MSEKRKLKIFNVLGKYFYIEQIVFIILYLILLSLSVNWGLPNDERMHLLVGGKITDLKLKKLSSLQKYYKEQDMKLEKLRGKDNNKNNLSEINPVFNEKDKIIAFRNYVVGSSATDERKLYSRIHKMSLTKLKYNPKHFAYGGTYLYPVSIVLFTLKLTGLFSANSNMDYCFRNPSQVSFMYIIGRMFNVIAFVLILGIIAYIGNNVRGRMFANIAVLTWSFSTMPLNYVVVSKPHMYATFWILISGYLMYRFLTSNVDKYFYLSAVLLGIAVGASIPSGLLFILYVFLLVQPKNIYQSFIKILIFGAIVLCVYIITNPFIISSYDILVHMFADHADPEGWDFFSFGISKLLNFFSIVLFKAYSFPLSIVAFIGLICLFFSNSWMKIRFSIGFLVLLILMGLTFSLPRYVMFVGLILSFLAAYSIDVFYRFINNKYKKVFIVCLCAIFIQPAVFASFFFHDCIYDNEWKTSVKEWVKQMESEKNITIGVNKKNVLNPVNLPPFPFLNYKVVDIYNSKNINLPCYVVLPNKNVVLQKWERHYLFRDYHVEFILGDPDRYNKFLRWRVKNQSSVSGWVFKRND